LKANAQQRRLPVIGFLHPASPDNTSDPIAGFRQGLREAGYVEGQNVVVEYRTAQGQRDKLPSMAADLADRRVDVVLANAVDAARAMAAATSTIPIVFVGANDPVQLGLAASHSRPGGNVTGVTYLGAELGQKRLQILQEVVPSAAVIGILVHRRGAIAREQVVGNAKSVEDAGRALGLRTEIIGVESRSDLDAAFARLVDFDQAR
jgi:putative ABC transport system substrate-binding protein